MTEFVIDPNFVAAASNDNPSLFWGYQDVRVPNAGYKIDAGAPAMVNSQKPQYLFVRDAEAMMYKWAKTDPQQYAAVRDRMVRSGLIPPDASGADVQRAWAAAVGASAQASAAETELSPFDAIDLLGGTVDQGQGPRNGTFTTAINRTATDRNRTKDVDLSSASEARAFLLAAAERELGRAATADEIAAFRRALNAEERANPEITDSVTTSRTTGTSSATYVDGEQTASNDNTQSSSDTNRTSRGGMDRGQFSIDYARSADDYAEYQAATTYMNTLFAALQSPVDVGTN
jgi:hypothetical protein